MFFKVVFNKRYFVLLLLLLLLLLLVSMTKPIFHHTLHSILQSFTSARAVNR